MNTDHELRHLEEQHGVSLKLPWYVEEGNGERLTTTIPSRVAYVAYGVRDPRIVFVVR